MHHQEKPLPDHILKALQGDDADKGRGLAGATGRFPGGKLTPDDGGELRFQVGAHKGKVLLDFGKPIAALGLTPQQARSLARVLHRRAQEAQDARPGTFRDARRQRKQAKRKRG